MPEDIMRAVLTEGGAWGVLVALLLYLYWRGQRALDRSTDSLEECRVERAAEKAEHRATIRRLERVEAANEAMAETIREKLVAAPVRQERYPKGHPKAGQFMPRDAVEA